MLRGGPLPFKAVIHCRHCGMTMQDVRCRCLVASYYHTLGRGGKGVGFLMEMPVWVKVTVARHTTTQWLMLEVVKTMQM